MKLVPIYRIHTYVVPESLDRVLVGVLHVDDLIYGNYKNVAWHSNDGIEQFVPSKNSMPTEGDIGERKQVTSFKLEFSIPRDKHLLLKVIEEGIYPNHPWDEPVVQVTEAFETRKHG
ncbi:hypothetical protein JUJ52_13475 [Virgibacillus sp. AGTR]|uniref:hypothetical protein n=1 Tax=Virgibacillus sp. AGTR TaxID=2812055 RepID=UPI001D16EAE4|nr:hypothetical protein [Virgibacillus sp. AGTR]MCC2250970.1 hypothetical protein [Virgibacillus sp. AGTR]